MAASNGAAAGVCSSPPLSRSNRPGAWSAAFLTVSAAAPPFSDSVSWADWEMGAAGSVGTGRFFRGLGTLAELGAVSGATWGGCFCCSELGLLSAGRHNVSLSGVQAVPWLGLLSVAMPACVSIRQAGSGMLGLSTPTTALHGSCFCSFSDPKLLLSGGCTLDAGH